MKTVMAFGTFDLMHPGHEYFLRQAKKRGDYLIAVIARDSTVKKLKGKLPYQSEKQRLRAIVALNLADKVILGDKGLNKYRVIKRYRPNVICLGYDQTYFIDGLKSKIKEFALDTKVIRLKSYQAHKYKSSIIKNEK
ncbi:MAG: FAD synthase [Parcubacteria group bacterium GW2011_GWC2_42_12]|nr:MAG: FAD synthase [Parcubacteria group bacterium GW2011_GWC2_42_12]KKT45220.1 MAG: FAD synthase [Parcubacteria group bacterium GW2011_GWA2_44_15]